MLSVMSKVVKKTFIYLRSYFSKSVAVSDGGDELPFEVQFVDSLNASCPTHVKAEGASCTSSMEAVTEQYVHGGAQPADMRNNESGFNNATLNSSDELNDTEYDKICDTECDRIRGTECDQISDKIREKIRDTECNNIRDTECDKISDKIRENILDTECDKISDKIRKNILDTECDKISDTIRKNILDTECDMNATTGAACDGVQAKGPGRERREFDIGEYPRKHITLHIMYFGTRWARRVHTLFSF
jgi:hypothetical protein